MAGMGDDLPLKLCLRCLNHLKPQFPLRLWTFASPSHGLGCPNAWLMLPPGPMP